MSIPGLPANADKVDPRRVARALYWKGWGVTHISAELYLYGIVNEKGLPFPRATIESWKQRERWDDASPLKRAEECAYTRFQLLIDKEKKSGGDLKELDAVGRQLERLARVAKFGEPDGNEADLNPKVANRNAGPRKKKTPSNYFTAEQVAELRRIFEEEMFEYNRTWEAAKVHRNRKILKSRQIGATFHFAREALLDALEGPSILPDGSKLGGGNQIFLSASKNQARVFRSYIVDFAARVGVMLKGDPIVVSSELMPADEPTAELYFLGTNSKTAQSYHGNFYFDEFFWVAGFEKLNKVATAMATHKRWRRTWMSTPSTSGHEAYPYWTGERRNRRRKKADQISIDISYERLKDGHLGEDRIWRHIVTVEDAERGGCNLFDIAELREEYADDEFANLFLCQFVDDSLSAFNFNQLLACGVDSLVDWTDVRWESSRPYRGNVWWGYDPQDSDDGDNAALVGGIPPSGPGGKFRLLEKHLLRGLDFQAQAEFIAAQVGRYPGSSYIGVDGSNAMGSAVAQLLRDRVAQTVSIGMVPYDIAAKAQMIMKAQHSIARGRLAFDSGWLDLVSAFLSIKKTLTSSGRSVTFKAARTENSHADLAWATMHILINEPLDGSERQKTSMEIF